MVTSSAARRRFNDDRLRHFGGHDRMVAFVCECGDASCTKTIMLPASEYETRSRSGPVVHESHHAASASG